MGGWYFPSAKISSQKRVQRFEQDLTFIPTVQVAHLLAHLAEHSTARASPHAWGCMESFLATAGSLCSLHSLEGVKKIAFYFAYASAVKFAEGRGATTSRVSKDLALPVGFQAEA